MNITIMIMLYLKEGLGEANVGKREATGKKEKRDAGGICHEDVDDQWADDAGGEFGRMWDDGGRRALG